MCCTIINIYPQNKFYKRYESDTDFEKGEQYTDNGYRKFK